MAERIGIVAVGQTKYQPNRADVNEGELVYEGFPDKSSFVVLNVLLSYKWG